MKLISVAIEDVSRIKPLWKELIHYLANQSTIFQSEFHQKTFETRIQSYANKIEEGWHLIEVAVDENNQKDVGYCLSSISKDLIGEIDSIFVQPEYRDLHLGDTFIRNALAFFEQHKTLKDIVSVSEGNENVLAYYQKYGFQTRYYQMVRTK